MLIRSKLKGSYFFAGIDVCKYIFCLQHAQFRPFLAVVFGFILASISVNLSAKGNSWQDSISFNSFYTLDLTYSADDMAINTNGSKLRSLEAEEFSFKSSIFGLQVQSQLSDQTSAFLQAVILNDNNDEAELVYDWAYLSYDFGNDSKLRLGKFQIPFLQGTELKSIGYTRLWARPVVPGSGAGGFTDFVGVEYLNTINLQNLSIDFQLASGELKHELDFIDGKSMNLAAIRFETRSYWVRLALLQARYQISTPNGAIVIDSNAKVVMASIEAEVNYNDYILNLGISDSSADIIPDDSFAYLSVGYQINNLTPYLLFRATRQHFDAANSLPGPGPGPPPGPGPNNPPPPLNGDNNTDAIAIGFRYDRGEKYAIKVQIEQLAVENNTRAGAAITNKDNNVFSISLEGVF